MKRHYNHQEIEAKWRKRWQEEKVDQADLASDNKFYCLDMFPYPSGDGLHVGHWRGYVLSDFYARYQRLQGKTVLHPMGFDSFGLPAENAAIKHKSYPQKFTDEAIARFRPQLEQIGASFDWSKSVSTSDPNYYKWTQWLFLQFFKHGLAEKRTALVNWCPNDQTVLANEQVVAGKCERCGTTVTKKELSQWFLKITDFAEELLDGLGALNWPEHVKTLQRNWIGKSEGAEITFESPAGPITIFTTRPDTLYGVTAIVVAPEHPLVGKLTTPEQQSDVTQYLAAVQAKTNIDRQQQKETAKTAVFTGSSAVHPLTKKLVPIWVADYVLLEYGTGAVMSVPAHDERDHLFARTHNLPVIEVINNENILINSHEYSGKNNQEVMWQMAEAAGGKKTTTYRLRDWLVSRQRYWGAPIPIVYDPDGKPHPVKDEHLPLLLPEDVDFLPGGDSPIARSQEYKQRAEELYGKGWYFEIDTLDTFVDSSWYFLRYLSPDDATRPFDPELIKKWIPVDLYIGGIEHAILHLLYARFVIRFLAKFGYIDAEIPEPFTQLFNIGMVNLHGAKMSKSKGNVISPDELVEFYGTDALRGYEMFIGPLDVEVEWNPRGINGVHRFLIKVWNLAEKVSPNTEPDGSFGEYLTAIEAMIADFRINTIVSEAMKLVNCWEKRSTISQREFADLLTTLFPIFPFLSAELWELNGGTGSVWQAQWPATQLSARNSITVFVGSKFLGSIAAAPSAPQEEVVAAIRQNERFAVRLSNQTIRTIIYKPGKMINFVVSE